MEELRNNDFVLQLLEEVLSKFKTKKTNEMIKKFYDFLYDKNCAEREAFLRLLVQEIEANKEVNMLLRAS